MNPVEQLGNITTSVSAVSPMRFQLLALTILALLLILTVAAAALKKATSREAAFWCVIWLTGAAAIFKPDLTMTLAKKLGIGRGADLLLYCAVGVMMVGFMMVYIRLRRIRREITLIVRHLALNEAKDGPLSREPKI
jgi:hypothetical protein